MKKLLAVCCWSRRKEETDDYDYENEAEYEWLTRSSHCQPMAPPCKLRLSVERPAEGVRG